MKKTWGYSSPRKAEEKMFPKAGVINNCYTLWREREKKTQAVKFHLICEQEITDISKENSFRGVVGTED